MLCFDASFLCRTLTGPCVNDLTIQYAHSIYTKKDNIIDLETIFNNYYGSSSLENNNKLQIQWFDIDGIYVILIKETITTLSDCTYKNTLLTLVYHSWGLEHRWRTRKFTKGAHRRRQVYAKTEHCYRDSTLSRCWTHWGTTTVTHITWLLYWERTDVSGLSREQTSGTEWNGEERGERWGATLFRCVLSCILAPRFTS